MGIFPIKDLRQAVETAKRILTKEKCIGSYWVNHPQTIYEYKDSYINKRVTIDTKDSLEEMIDL